MCAKRHKPLVLQVVYAYFDVNVTDNYCIFTIYLRVIS